VVLVVVVVAVLLVGCGGGSSSNSSNCVAGSKLIKDPVGDVAFPPCLSLSLCIQKHSVDKMTVATLKYRCRK
jgi:hypothetical protein